MAFAHRNSDARICGATTIASGQNFVKINGQLWAVNGDPNSHGDGQLIASTQYIKIGGKNIIVVGDAAAADDLIVGPHADPIAVGSASFVEVN